MSQWIGIDVGTQGTKGLLFDNEWRPIASAFEPSHLIQADGIWQEPQEMLNSVVAVLAALMRDEHADASAVGGVGVDSQMAGIMGIDGYGEAATMYDSWLDTRCAPETEEMRRIAGDRVVSVTGGPISCTHGPKILYCQKHTPDQYRRVSKFVLPHAYVVGKLCGLTAEQSYFDYTCLQYSGFGDNLRKEWSRELLDKFGLSEDKFPRIVSPFEIVGRLTAAMAAPCGLKTGTPFVAGAGDTAASLFGSGMFEAGQSLDCAGTASVFSGVVSCYRPDLASLTLSMMRSPIDGLWYPLAYIGGGGLCVRWLRDQFGSSYEELERQAADVAPGSDGLVFSPHFSGRVLPCDMTMKGTFLGLQWSHTRGHLYRAMMESIAYEYRFYQDALNRLFPDQPISELYAVGGGAKSDLFLRIKSDVLGLPVTSFEMGDAALLGSAVIAAHGVGALTDYRSVIRKAMRANRHIVPDVQAHNAYIPYYEAYSEALDRLSALYGSRAFQKIAKGVNTND